MEFNDIHGLYQFKSKSCNDAIYSDGLYSMAFSDPRLTEMYHKLRDDPQNATYLQELSTIQKENGTLESLEAGKTISSSFNEMGYHKYTVQRYVEYTDAQKAIQDPNLMSTYVAHIPGYNGVILPGTPLHDAFSKDMAPSEYIRLKKESAQAIRDNTVDMYKLTANGEKIPLGTIIILHSDMVRVKEYVMDGTRQELRLSTSKMHTFRDGEAVHCFEILKDQPNKLQFSNHGEGTSPVWMGGGWLNNTIANFMWAASPQVGALAYKHYQDIKPQSEAEWNDFAKDTSRSFATHLSKHLTFDVRQSIAALKMLGSGMGSVNLFFVTYMAQDIDQAALLAEKARADLFNPNQVVGENAAQWKVTIDDNVASKLDLEQHVENKGMLQKVYELGHKPELKEPLPKELEGALPGPYTSEMERMGLLGDQHMFPFDLFHANPEDVTKASKEKGGFDLTNLKAESFKDVADNQEQVVEKMQEVLNQKAKTYLSDEKIIEWQQEHEEAMEQNMKQIDAKEMVSPSDMKREVTKRSLAEEQLMQNMTIAMNKVREPVLQSVLNHMKQAGMSQTQLPLHLLHNQLTMRFKDCVGQNIFPSFTDSKTGFHSRWTNLEVMNYYTNPTSAQKYGEAVIEQIVAKFKHQAEVNTYSHIIDVHERASVKKQSGLHEPGKEKEKKTEKQMFDDAKEYMEKVQVETAELHHEKAEAAKKSTENLHHFETCLNKTYYERMSKKKKA